MGLRVNATRNLDFLIVHFMPALQSGRQVRHLADHMRMDTLEDSPDPLRFWLRLVVVLTHFFYFVRKKFAKVDDPRRVGGCRSTLMGEGPPCSPEAPPALSVE